MSSARANLALEKCMNFTFKDLFMEIAMTEASNILTKEEKLKQFAIWYNLYDYKKARIKAEKAWLKIPSFLYREILEHTEKMVQVTHKDGTFPSRPYPATYLNQMRWEDEITSQDSEDSFRSDMRRLAGG